MTNYDKTLPSGSASIRLGDDKIRDNMAALEEALSVEHNFPDNAGGSRRGRHKFGVGTQAARTAAIGTPATGEVWFDTNYYAWSVYDGTAWRVIGSRIGDIRMWGGSPAFNSEGWYVCNGQLLSRTTYAGLLSVIGLKYNDNGESGPLVPPEDGTNFRVPNFQGYTPVGWWSGGDTSDGSLDYQKAGNKYGEKRHLLDISEIPSHNHPGSGISTLNWGFNWFADTGSSNVGSGGQGSSQSANHTHTLTIAAEGGGLEHENRPLLITVSFLIYAGV